MKTSWVGGLYKSVLSEIVQNPEFSFQGMFVAHQFREVSFWKKKNVFTWRHSSNKHNELVSFACSLVVIFSLVFLMSAFIGSDI